MNAKEKENLYTLLRDYHTDPVLQEPSTSEAGGFAEDLEQVKDKIISMSLGLIRGTTEFKDWTPELNDLAAKAKPHPTDTRTGKKERKLMGDKINQLRTIVAFVRTM